MSKLTRYVRNIVAMVIMISVISALIVNLIALWITPMFLIPYISQLSMPIFIIMPLPIVFTFVTGLEVMIWIMIVIVIITASALVLLIRDLKNYIQTVRKNFLEPNSRIQRFSELFVISIFFSTIGYLIAVALGVKVHIPSFSGPIWETLVVLSNAGVYEELITRVLLLGVPLLITYLLLHKVNKHNWFRFFIGGKFELNKITMIFLLISSLFFGIAHIPSWDVTKFPGAFIAGLILGYLFLRYGIYASITFHFLTDYLVTIIKIYPAYTLSYSVILSILLILWVVAGAVYTLIYATEILKHFNIQSHKLKKIKFNSTVTQSSLKFYEYTCPYCGYDSFEYLNDGSLKCLRCGKVFKK